MFNNFSEEARKIIILAKSEMQDLNHPYVSSEHLLLAILKSNNSVSTRLKKYNITYDKFKEEIIKIIGKGNKKSEWVLYTPMFKTILEKAILISNDSNVDLLKISVLLKETNPASSILGIKPSLHRIKESPFSHGISPTTALSTTLGSSVPIQYPSSLLIFLFTFRTAFFTSISYNSGFCIY